MWVNPVYDRTEFDAINKMPKGYCNAEDLNRIEGNCEHLAGLLGVTIQTKGWTEHDFPTHAELARINSNIATLRQAYYAYPETPPNPSNPLNQWEKWNAAEKILYDLNHRYKQEQDNYTYTGEIYAGEQIGVV